MEGLHRVGQEGVGGKCGQQPLFWFLWERTSKAGQTGLGWCLNNFSGLWGVVAASNCLVPGTGVIRAG